MDPFIVTNEPCRCKGLTLGTLGVERGGCSRGDPARPSRLFYESQTVLNNKVTDFHFNVIVQEDRGASRGRGTPSCKGTELPPQPRSGTGGPLLAATDAGPRCAGGHGKQDRTWPVELDKIRENVLSKDTEVHLPEWPPSPNPPTLAPPLDSGWARPGPPSAGTSYADSPATTRFALKGILED